MTKYRIKAVMEDGQIVDKKFNLSSNFEEAECEVECYLPGIKKVIMFGKVDAPCWTLNK